MEPNLVDYHKLPSYANVIYKLNEEYKDLEGQNDSLKKELEFYKSAFKYPHSNSAVFNLLRVKRNGEDVWIDRIKVTQNELKGLDQCEIVRSLLEQLTNFRYRRD